MSGKLAKVTGFKKFLYLAACIGSAVVIVGALFKIMHWPGASQMLIIGLLTEAAIFLLYAKDIPHEEWDWSLAYPNLIPQAGHDHEHEEETENAEASSRIRCIALIVYASLHGKQKHLEKHQSQARLACTTVPFLR